MHVAADPFRFNQILARFPRRKSEKFRWKLMKNSNLKCHDAFCLRFAPSKHSSKSLRTFFSRWSRVGSTRFAICCHITHRFSSSIPSTSRKEGKITAFSDCQEHPPLINQDVIFMDIDGAELYSTHPHPSLTCFRSRERCELNQEWNYVTQLQTRAEQCSVTSWKDSIRSKKKL